MAETWAATPSRDVRTIGLITTAHGLSHFNQLVLPPLFPVLKAAYGVSYTDLGLMMALFYTCSGLAQTPAGFLVDRLGARRVLLGGITLYGASIALMGLASTFWLMLALVVLAGLGNSVFHPSDYAILTASVNPKRLARAYGVHTLGGNIGWAAAPVTVLTLSALIGWHGALVVIGLGGIGVALLLGMQGAGLGDRRPARAAASRNEGPVWRVLLSLPVVMCFAYFALLSVALIGMQTFLPAALAAAHGTAIAVASTALTGYLLGGGVGILAGGFLADHFGHPGRIVACGLSVAAALILSVGFMTLSAAALIAAMTGAGFAYGITTPSRDVLVRGATPPGSAGRVFGFVYSGLDLGSAVTPPMLGFVIDHGASPMVFALSAAVSMLAILTAVTLGQRNARRPAESPLSQAAE